jgi:hypothetical protein
LCCGGGCECRHHQHGRWQARIGRVSGNKDLYLGTFSMQTPFLPSYTARSFLLQCASISRRRRLQRVRACRVASSRSARSMATDGAGQHELMQGEAEAVMAGGYKAEPCLSPSSFLCAHACSALVCDCVVQPRPATSDLMSPFVWERKALAPNHAPRPLPCQRMSSCFTPLISFCMPEARCLSLSRLALCLLCGMVWPSACISMCDP